MWIASEMFDEHSGVWLPTFAIHSAAQVAKHVAQRPDHEFLFFSLLLQFNSCG